MEVPSGIDVASTTIPYYRSTYVFVSRRDRDLRIRSFDDPRLKDLRIGVHLTGENDEEMPPTAHCSNGVWYVTSKLTASSETSQNKTRAATSSALSPIKQSMLPLSGGHWEDILPNILLRYLWKPRRCARSHGSAASTLPSTSPWGCALPMTACDRN